MIPRRSHRGLSIVGAAAAAVLGIGGFGAVVAGSGPGDTLYGVRSMLFGAPKQVRDDQVALAAKTELAQVQNLIAQGDWQQAQDKLVAVSTQVASIGDQQQKQELLDQFNDLSAKVVERDPEAIAPPGITYTVPPSATELVPAVAPTSTPSAPPPSGSTAASESSSTPPESSTSSAATSGTESAPTFALTGDGRIVISWLENNGGNNDIKFAIYDPRETTIIGDNNDNVILARLNENSTLSGLGGDDLLYGRDGSDSISGGDGNDTIDGGKGNDVIYGGLDNDYISGFVGNDTLAGQAGNDTIQAGGGDDKAFGNGGDDRVNGGSGNDTLTGSAGNDTIYGGTGADQLFGNADNDRLIGEDDNDKLVGLDGDDQLYAGKGDDTLKGGLGNDTMSGGAGADLFVFEANSGDDVVTGYSSAQGDVLQLIGITGFDEFADVQAAASQVGGDVVIDLGGGNSLTLVGVNLGDLHAGDFLFG